MEQNYIFKIYKFIVDFSNKGGIIRLMFEEKVKYWNSLREDLSKAESKSRIYIWKTTLCKAYG